MTTVRIATRESDLAMAQARQVAGMLRERLGVSTELVPMLSTGDRIQSVSLAKLGGKGLFVKEIEEALLDGRADLAVHSGKDLPALMPEGLELVAFPERADPRDALVARERGATLAGLRRGARVGTGSVRRTAQLRALRPDLDVVPIRGNVATRLRKLDELELDAVVLACAGLDRLGLSDRIDERLAPEAMLPAVAQGILAIQGRTGDPIARDAVALSHPPTEARALAERGVLVKLRADCTVPLAAYAEGRGGGLHLRSMLASTAGDRLARAEETGDGDPAELGSRVAAELLENGGASLLEELRAEPGA
jgi:hydroxymethylbilane synthase